jgi:hypothetical protein
MKTNKTFLCPVCGGEVHAGAAACPHCGSDECTGWSDKTYLDGIDLGIDDKEYNDLLEQEFPSAAKKKRSLSWVAIVAAVLLVLSIIGFIKMIF